MQQFYLVENIINKKLSLRFLNFKMEKTRDEVTGNSTSQTTYHCQNLYESGYREI